MMLNSELIKRLKSFGKDADRVLIEFPDVGGPYRSPGSIEPLVDTDITIINAVYPRNNVIVHDFFIELMNRPRDGEVRLLLIQSGPSLFAYYGIKAIRIYEKGIVLIAGEFIKIER